MNGNKQAREGAVLLQGFYADFLPPGLRDKARDAFFYAGDLLPLGVGASFTDNIAIQDDSHFLVAGAVCTVRTNAAPPVIVPQPALTVTIEDTGSGRNLQNRALDIENVFGTAQLPNIWPYPKLIRRASSIATTFANNTGIAVQIRYLYIGFKVFPGISARQQDQQYR